MNATCQPANSSRGAVVVKSPCSSRFIIIYHFQVLLGSYYFKIPFDVKTTVSVAKNELIDRGQSLAAIPSISGEEVSVVSSFYSTVQNKVYSLIRDSVVQPPNDSLKNNT